MLYRQATAEIAKEAVETVLEHGAGHPRKDFEAERNELARRFRLKYGSDYGPGEPGRSNAAPHFVGVFETVAALGARGPVRLAIQGAIGFLILNGSLIIAVALTAIYWILRTVVATVLNWVAGGHHTQPAFVPVFLGLTLASLAAISFAAWYKYRASVTKVIKDFANKGDVSKHCAVWHGENFDELMSEYVHYGRSANGIDERRRDFYRVGWGSANKDPGTYEGHLRLKQVWFAGDHSDIGGSYAETESRLSDIALEWMIEQATEIPDPIIVNSWHRSDGVDKIPGLHIFPSFNGVQHCQVAAMNDTIAIKSLRWLLWLTRRWSWPVKERYVDPGGEIHPSVTERFKLAWVAQAAGSGPYRPKPLREDSRFTSFYSSTTPAQAPGSDIAKVP